jgi:hypothetical protein
MYEKYIIRHTFDTIHTYIAIHTIRVFVLPLKKNQNLRKNRKFQTRCIQIPDS